MAEKGAVSGGPHDLLDQLVELERENKHQADTIAQLRAEGGGGGGGLRHQDRYYEDEVANLHVSLCVCVCGIINSREQITVASV